jgi:hypothetical protein
VEPPPKFNRAALAKLIPPRDAQASSNLIDLSPHYNVPWPHVQASRLEKTLLPCGLHFLDGVSFDVRGVIQLANQDNLEDYPVEVKGINVGLKCRRLAFLHATRLEATYNTRIGAFLIHYADGQDQAIPINYARNVLNCWRGSTDLTEIPGATVAWRGTNEVAQAGTAPWLQLYKMAWENPRPDQVIQSLDYQSTRSTCKPFLIAITVEP